MFNDCLKKLSHRQSWIAGMNKVRNDCIGTYPCTQA